MMKIKVHDGRFLRRAAAASVPPGNFTEALLSNGLEADVCIGGLRQGCQPSSKAHHFERFNMLRVKELKNISRGESKAFL
jgi:hypothetical protein